MTCIALESAYNRPR